LKMNELINEILGHIRDLRDIVFIDVDSYGMQMEIPMTWNTKTGKLIYAHDNKKIFNSIEIEGVVIEIESFLVSLPRIMARIKKKIKPEELDKMISTGHLIDKIFLDNVNSPDFALRMLSWTDFDGLRQKEMLIDIPMPKIKKTVIADNLKLMFETNNRTKSRKRMTFSRNKIGFFPGLDDTVFFYQETDQEYFNRVTLYCDYKTWQLSLINKKWQNDPSVDADAVNIGYIIDNNVISKGFRESDDSFAKRNTDMIKAEEPEEEVVDLQSIPKAYEGIDKILKNLGYEASLIGQNVEYSNADLGLVLEIVPSTKTTRIFLESMPMILGWLDMNKIEELDGSKEIEAIPRILLDDMIKYARESLQPILSDQNIGKIEFVIKTRYEGYILVNESNKAT